MNEVETDAPAPAALWRRGVARFIDYFAMCWVLFALQVLSITSWVDSTPTALVTIAGLYALLEIVYIANRGQTPAKEWLKIRIAHPANQDRARRGLLGWRVAIVRWLVPGLVLALPLVLPWWTVPIALVLLGVPALLDPQRRTVYDRLAGTTVVPYDAKVVEGPIKTRQSLVRNAMDRNIAAVAGEPKFMNDNDPSTPG